MLANMVGNRIVESTLKKAAKSDRKIMAPLIKFYRTFLGTIRKLLDMFGAGTTKQLLQQYETYAIATLIELTDEVALAGLGISLPETRIRDRKDAILPANVVKKRAGYEVTLPGTRLASRVVPKSKMEYDEKGNPILEEDETIVFEDDKKVTIKKRVPNTKYVKTREEALELNARKFEEYHRMSKRAAEASVELRKADKSLKASDTVKMVKDKVAPLVDVYMAVMKQVAGRVGISPESLYSMLQVRVGDSELDAILTLLANKTGTRSESAVMAILNDKFDRMNEAMNSMAEVINADGLTEGARQAIMASRLATRLGADALAAKSPQAAYAARMIQNQFLRIARRGMPNIKALDRLHEDKQTILTEIAALEQDDMFTNQVPTKERIALDERLKKVDAMIEAGFQEQSNDFAKAVAQSKKAGAPQYRGLVRDTDAAMALSAAANASTGIHEAIHQLQYIKHPYSNKSLLQVALGPNLAAKVGNWITSVTPKGQSRLEAMAEGIEQFVAEGKIRGADKATNDAFAKLSKAVAEVYKARGEAPGFAINSNVRKAFQKLFTSTETITPAGIAGLQQDFLQTLKNTQISDTGYLIPPLPNNKPQSGFKNKKVADNMLSKYIDDYAGKFRTSI